MADSSLLTRPMATTLPVEIWERVIDHLWTQFETLKACALVCRDWRARSRFHLIERVVLEERAQVWQLARVVRRSAFHAEAVRRIIIRGGPQQGDRRPIAHLTTFAAMAARKLAKLEVLSIWSALWAPGVLHADVILHLSAFTSVTRLVLYEVTLPSPQVLGQLLCALTGVYSVWFGNVSFVSPLYDAAFFQAHPPRKLTGLHLDGDAIGDIIEFFVVTGIASAFKTIWLGYNHPVPFHAVRTLGIHRLLSAAVPALRHLEVAMDNPAPSAPPNTIAPIHEISRQTAPVDLTLNTHLEELHLRTALRTTETDTSWTSHVLTHLPPSRLRSLHIILDAAYEPLDVSLDDVLRAFTPVQYASVDKALCAREFAHLQTVQFRMLGAPGRAMPEQRRWLDALATRLPTLCTRGILNAKVDVSNPLY